jgi:hypothetical protein
VEKRPRRTKSRRYEVLLPAQFNDGNEVPEEIDTGLGKKKCTMSPCLGLLGEKVE